jgi:hypothetical protein
MFRERVCWRDHFAHLIFGERRNFYHMLWFWVWVPTTDSFVSSNLFLLKA